MVFFEKSLHLFNNRDRYDHNCLVQNLLLNHKYERKSKNFYDFIYVHPFEQTLKCLEFLWECWAILQLDFWAEYSVSIWKIWHYLCVIFNLLN